MLRRSLSSTKTKNIPIFHRRMWFIPGGTTLLVAFLLFTWSIIAIIFPDRAGIFSKREHQVIQPILENPTTQLKIYTHSNGMVEVTSQELEAYEPSWRDVNTDGLKLYYRGEERPLWVEAQKGGFTLRFYAEASDSLYSKDNIVILGRSGQNGRRMALRQPQGQDVYPITGETTYTTTISLEENQEYVPQVKEGDHWLWSLVPAPDQKEFNARLQDIIPGRGKLRIGIFGGTESPITPDHHLRLSVNGKEIGDQKWDGRGWQLLECDIPEGLLINGDNIITVKAVGDTGASADIVYINRIEVDYSRRLVADKDRLEFYSSGNLQLIEGFTGTVDIFDITELTDVAWSGNFPKTGNKAITFRGEYGHRYLALGSNGYQKPSQITSLKRYPDLSQLISGKEFIVIGSPDLLEALEPLLNWRIENGLQSMAIPVEVIYDQFNSGFPEPEAIRNFIKFAWSTWSPAPKYVLLVGDATFDPRGYISPEEINYLPTFFVQTEFGGETASDFPFAELDGDTIPDIIVGRIPASKPDQARILVDKILKYESNMEGEDWQKRILAIADGQDPSFKRDAEAFLHDFPALYDTRLYSPSAGVEKANTQVEDLINDGALIIGYFGHGSINMWGKDRLFTSKDAENLKNEGKLPLIINMTCLTGLFTHPKTMSLTESLLWQSQGGAVAILAPSSLTLPTDQMFLANTFVRAYLANPSTTLGQIFLNAQQHIPLEGAGTRDVLYTFLLFGDPALHLVNSPLQ